MLFFSHSDCLMIFFSCSEFCLETWGPNLRADFAQLHRIQQKSVDKNSIMRTPGIKSLKRLCCKLILDWVISISAICSASQHRGRSMSILTEGQPENGPYTMWWRRDVPVSPRHIGLLSVHWKVELNILPMEICYVHDSLFYEYYSNTGHKLTLTRWTLCLIAK